MSTVKIIIIETQKKDQVVDITERVEDEIRKINVESGVCVLSVLHTTCALTTADLDPGTDLDLLEVLRKLLPKVQYRHPHDPGHTPDHILSTLIGPSVTVPFENKKLLLGTWQKIILVELSGPRERQIVISFVE